MKLGSVVAMALSLLVLVSISGAELDLDQEVLIIPDTHNEKPYIWNVVKNPKGFGLSMEYSPNKTGSESEIGFTIQPAPDPREGVMHVFVTDADLHAYDHIRPSRSGEGKYTFKYSVPRSGKYRFEIVFKTERGWVNLRKDLKVKADGQASGKNVQIGDEEYDIKLSLVPKKSYAEHVTTFHYEISYKGELLKGLETIDGFDMHVAAWDEYLKEFIYAVPQQNLGGPRVAVSVVFMRPGRHAIFAEFRHKGVVRRIDSIVFVHEEQRHDGSAIENLRPAE